MEVQMFGVFYNFVCANARCLYSWQCNCLSWGFVHHCGNFHGQLATQNFEFVCTIENILCTVLSVQAMEIQMSPLGFCWSLSQLDMACIGIGAHHSTSQSSTLDWSNWKHHSDWNTNVLYIIVPALELLKCIQHCRIGNIILSFWDSWGTEGHTSYITALK